MAEWNYGTLWRLVQRIQARQMWRFDQFYNALEEAGLPRTLTSARTVWNLSGQLRAHRDLIAARPGDYVPTYEAILESPLNYRQQYAYTVELRGVDRLTGESVTQPVIVESDRLLTLEDAVFEAIGAPVEGRPTGLIVPEGGSVLQVERSRRFWEI